MGSPMVSEILTHIWPLQFKGQGQTLKISKPNISKRVREREKMSIEDFDVERLKNRVSIIEVR